MDLSQYRKLFSLGYGEFIEALKVSSQHVHNHLRYEKLRDVTRIDGSENEFFFFQDGRLKIIYISNEVLTEQLWNEFRALNDGEAPEHDVRSRAGKTSNQLIYASYGLTASINGDEVDFIELYAPCSVDEYLETIYREPGLFIR